MKNRIYNSLKNKTFSIEVFENAEDVKKERKKDFDEIERYYLGIKKCKLEFFRRIVESLCCVFMIILGVSAGFCLRRVHIVFPILLAGLFVGLYFIFDAVFMNASINGYWWILKYFGGCLSLFPIILIFLFKAVTNCTLLFRGWWKNIKTLFRKIVFYLNKK